MPTLKGRTARSREGLADRRDDDAARLCEASRFVNRAHDRPDSVRLWNREAASSKSATPAAIDRIIGDRGSSSVAGVLLAVAPGREGGR